MKLTILGCSGSIPGPGSPASGYLVESGDTRILLDLGNGTLGTLQRFSDPFEPEALLLSHLHPDHCADFGALTVLRRYHPSPPYDPTARKLTVFAPEEAPERLAALYAPNEVERASADLSDVFEFAPVPEAPVRVGPFEIQAFPVHHVCPSWGFRVAAEGRVLAYTADTGPCDGLAELAHEADVLLAEASWPDSPERPDGLHLSGKQAAELAERSSVGRLLLTHLQPWCDEAAILAEAREHTSVPTELVSTAAEYRV
ncbi:MBL fold metallo-hydrolase [Actinopolyspora erythraea]|uniref:Beta-lactamase n=1 Tax=Actinopolyspora erythraea TaxID=414996 RepID=A0A099D2C3_9ACTN|nr:MBL fold metallo-hydrolase [Actinopolyspora erythraea]ASU79626.1 MBL fold metallo-hydrolase [Actinopolyspora erythraea]KGI79450.1 beta-lactamase [Actinopolyspora erythraea]